MNPLARSFALLAFTVAAASAQESPAAPPDSAGRLERKLDRMDSKLEVIREDVQVIRNETVESPLGGRKWGIEFNPARTLVFAGDGLNLSGGVSNFSWDRSAEIAFPFVYSNLDEGDEGNSTMFSQDVHYRYFLSGRQRGFYLGGYVRYQHAEYHELDLNAFEARRRSLNRGGLAFELGGRVFSRRGLYWGWSFSLGRYLVGDEVNEEAFPSNPMMVMGDLILDVELLKIGFAF